MASRQLATTETPYTAQTWEMGEISMTVDILAFGAHPDDAEIGCGGLLLKKNAAGRAGRVSPGPERGRRPPAGTSAHARRGGPPAARLVLERPGRARARGGQTWLL